MKIYKLRLRFHWSLFLGTDQAISHYLNQWWIVYWCKYASRSLSELTRWYLWHIRSLIFTALFYLQSWKTIFLNGIFLLISSRRSYKPVILLMCWWINSLMTIYLLISGLVAATRRCRMMARQLVSGIFPNPCSGQIAIVPSEYWVLTESHIAVRFLVILWDILNDITGLILDLGPPNERHRYKVTPSLIGWAQT